MNQSSIGTKSNSNITEHESFFSVDELFFSRTDKKGTIISGNSIFKRVSEFEWNELIHKPHNLIRHEHMPRGVFQLFWETIKTGAPIAAYVKNKSKTGKYYWVLALAVNTDDGYVSIRLKPTSSLLDVVKKEYDKLLSLENTKNLTPQQSKSELLSALEKLGFKTYEEFMVLALMTELESRQKLLERAPIQILEQLNHILNSSKTLIEKSQLILKSYHQSSRIPLNLEIQTQSMGEVGAPLAVVAAKYEEMAKEIHAEVLNFEKSSMNVKINVQNCQYFLCANILQNEVLQFFKNESEELPFDINSELATLNDLTQFGIEMALSSVLELSKEFSKFNRICEELKTLSTGLDIVRLTGKIEIARLSGQQSDLENLIGELLKFKESLAAVLNEISTIGGGLKTISLNMLNEIEDQKYN